MRLEGDIVHEIVECHPIFKRRCGPRVLRCVEGAWPNTAQEWDSVASSAEGLARQSETTDICPVRQTTHTEVVWNGWEALFPKCLLFI